MKAIIAGIFIIISIYSEAKPSMCNHVKKENWKKVDRSVKSIILKHKKADLYVSPTSSYHYYSPSLDSICAEINTLDCVDTALWDKYATKIAIYPGHSTIGVRFLSDTGFTERCYLVQEGGIRRMNSLLRWTSIYMVDRHRLFYEGSDFCNGFIEEQIKIFKQKKKKKRKVIK
ncbi:hypothetical protein GYB22_08370 [bacterium]|nr:hypothetical protein [bacterium]